ncbi:MAG: hypothetical protein ACREX9_11600 [Gammaproteobacteria bacterium]
MPIERKAMTRFVLAALSFFVVTPVFTADPPAKPIVGTWEWTKKENNCTETYTYRADGTSLVESGQEKNEDKYEISGKAEGSDRLRMKVTTVKDNGGKDCAGNDKDNTGQTAVVFVEFDSSYNEMIVCLDEKSFKCFGPLKRVAR